MEVVEAVEGDEAPPLQFMHFLLVEEWSELELVGESWDFFPFSNWRLRKFNGCTVGPSSSESCDLDEQFLHEEGRPTSEAEVTSSSEAPVGCSLIGGGEDLLRDELLLLFELVVVFEIFFDFVFVGLLCFTLVGSLC